MPIIESTENFIEDLLTVDFELLGFSTVFVGVDDAESDGLCAGDESECVFPADGRNDWKADLCAKSSLRSTSTGRLFVRFRGCKAGWDGYLTKADGY